MTRSERAQRVSHASGPPSRSRRFGASAVASAEAEVGSETGARERPPTLFELRRGLAVALAKAEACRGVRGGEAPREKR
jgi:hypothetical protein